MANSKDDDILRDAIIGTEREIFGDAFGKEDLTHDETGDRSQEEMGEGLEGQVEPEEDDDEEGTEVEQGATDESKAEVKDKSEEEVASSTAAKAEAEAKQAETQGRVPAGRLREEAERARKAEAERETLKAQLEAEKANAQNAIAALNAKFEAMLAEVRKPPPVVAKDEPIKPPDLFEDPNAFVEHLSKGFDAKLDAMRRDLRDQQVNASIETARAKHGQVFEAAFGALKTLDFRGNPDNVQLVRRLEASPNPGEAVVAWHKRNEALREVGTDIGSYKARIAEETRKSLMADPEFRKELLASLREEALIGNQGRVRTEVRLPKSLSQTTGSNARAPNDLEIFDGSERATFDSAWAT
jgi:hypothetical protein